MWRRNCAIASFNSRTVSKGFIGCSNALEKSTSSGKPAPPSHVREGITRERGNNSVLEPMFRRRSLITLPFAMPVAKKLEDCKKEATSCFAMKTLTQGVWRLNNQNAAKHNFISSNYEHCHPTQSRLRFTHTKTTQTEHNPHLCLEGFHTKTKLHTRPLD